MALLKTRPTIQLLAPRAIVMGSRFDAEVRLHAPEDVEVEQVHVDLRCRAGWTVGSGKHRVSHYQDVLHLRSTPFAGPLLRAGHHALRCWFDLPPALPPSYEGGAASVRWRADVEASIPWWPDARSQHPLHAVLPDVRGHQPSPSTYRQQVASVGDPRIEASLVSSVLVPGGRVAGAIALYDLDPKSTLDVRVGLVEHDVLVSRNGSHRQRQGRAWHVRVEVPAGTHPNGTPFEFALPVEVAPTFATTTFAHRHVVEIQVKTGMFSTSTLAIPVTVVNDATLRDRSLGLAAPSVGASRMAELGRDVAARRGYTLDGAVLSRTEDVSGVPVTLELQHENRPGEGTQLTAHFAFPRVGLDLAVAPQTGLAGYFARDLEIGDELWDRAHRVSARDAAQATPFLRALVQHTGSAATFASIGDDHATMRVPDPESSAQSLDAFAAYAERIAAAIGRSVPAAAIAPSGVTIDPAWERLAARLGARWVTGDLGLDDGALGTTSVSVRTRWHDALAHLVVLEPETPIPDDETFTLAAPHTQAPAADSLAPDVRALLARLPVDAVNLEVAARRIAIEVPFDRRGPRPEDVAAVVDLLARLPALFGTRRGPFR